MHSTSFGVHSPSTSLLGVSPHCLNQLSSAKLIVHKPTPGGAAQTRTLMPATISISEQTQVGFCTSVINQCTSFCRGTCRGTSSVEASCRVPGLIQRHIRLRLCRPHHISHSSLCLSGSSQGCWSTSMPSQCPTLRGPSAGLDALLCT